MQIKRPRKKTLLYGNECGTTMAEVLVGFAFLMILMVSLAHMIDISSKFLMMAKDTVSEQERFQEQLYRKVPDAEAVNVTMLEDVTLTFYEMDGVDETASRTGTSLKLERAAVKASKDRVLGVTVYQVLYFEDKHDGTEQTE